MRESWIWWLPLGAAALHITEEFVFPGGFAAWDRAYRPRIRSSITPRFHILINALLIVVCATIAMTPHTPRAIAGWLTIAALLFGNAVFHFLGTIRTRRYSPGLVTGVGLYVPSALFGFWHFVGTGAASVGTAASAALLGGSYPLWSSVMHTLRARRTARPTPNADRPS